MSGPQANCQAQAHSRRRGASWRAEGKVVTRGGEAGPGELREKWSLAESRTQSAGIPGPGLADPECPQVPTSQQCRARGPGPKERGVSDHLAISPGLTQREPGTQGRPRRHKTLRQLLIQDGGGPRPSCHIARADPKRGGLRDHLAISPGPTKRERARVDGPRGPKWTPGPVGVGPKWTPGPVGAGGRCFCLSKVYAMFIQVIFASNRCLITWRCRARDLTGCLVMGCSAVRELPAAL